MIMFLLLFILSLLLLIYYLLTKKYQYWNRKGVPHLKPSLLFGNYKELILLRKHAPLVAHEICQQFPELPYVGTYYGPEPSLIVKDPEVIKQVMAKDFYYFSGRDLAKFSHHELLTQNLFFTHGDTWKVIRHNLKPIFSLAKMKKMFYLIKESSNKFEKLLKEEINQNSTVETIDLCARFAIDGVMSCIFGIHTDSFERKQTVSAFAVIGKKIMISSTFRAMKVMFRAFWPRVFYMFKLKMYDTEIYYFLHDLLIDVFKSRNYKPSSRNDFVDLFLSWKNKEYLTSDPIDSTKKDEEPVKLKVNDNLLIAQCSMLFGAGYDTSAHIISLTLFELAKKPDIQERALAEVDEYFETHSGIEYKCVYDVPYLDACVDEALRMYPVAGLMPREVFSDYTFSTGLHLEKGVRIHIPVYHLHHNPKYFPEPDTFRPERFYGKEKEKIVAYSYMPFGEGSRICLGIRFAKMQMLAGLLVILKNYEVRLADNMPHKLNLDPRGIILQVMGGIYLKFKPRNKVNS